MIFLHHPPFETGIWWMDCIGLTGARELEAVVRRHPQVRLVVAGHVHRPVTTTWGTTIVSIAPSTCHQTAVALHTDCPPRMTNEPPMLALHQWTGDAFVSHVTVFTDVGSELDLTEADERLGHGEGEHPRPRADGQGRERRRMSDIAHIVVGVARNPDRDRGVARPDRHRRHDPPRATVLGGAQVLRADVAVVFAASASESTTPSARERFLVPYGPVSLVGLLAVWVAFLVFGWGLMWWGLQNHIDGIDGVV